jgi:hypothetical protein
MIEMLEINFSVVRSFEIQWHAKEEYSSFTMGNSENPFEANKGLNFISWDSEVKGYFPIFPIVLFHFKSDKSFFCSSFVVGLVCFC